MAIALIRAVVFDVDGVLVHPWRFRDRLREEHGITPEMTAPFFRGPFLECVLGRADLREVLVPYLESWTWKGSVDALLQLWFTAENAPNAAVLTAVRELREKGLRCFAASVQERRRAHYLTHDMGFGVEFDALFFSCDLGVRKPDVAFFEKVGAQIGEAPGQLLFIDDHEANVDGARAAGWVAEQFVDEQKLAHDLARHLPA